MLPELREDGKLPAGEHSASFDALAARFGGPSQTRRRLTRALENLLPALEGVAHEIYIFGSYVTEKLAPEDLDIFIILREDWIRNDPTRAVDLLDIRSNISQHNLELWFAPQDDAVLIRDRFQTCTYDPDNPGSPKGYVRLEV